MAHGKGGTPLFSGIASLVFRYRTDIKEEACVDRFCGTVCPRTLYGRRQFHSVSPWQMVKRNGVTAGLQRLDIIAASHDMGFPCNILDAAPK
jgi:hypothetical protein